MLELNELSIRFGKHPPVVKNVSLRVAQNKKTVIVGESGSGKSVLLLAVLKLLPPQALIEGKILFDSKNLLDCGEREMNSIRGAKIAYIPQGSGNGLNPLYTIGHQLKESLLKYGVADKQTARSKTVKILNSLNFENSNMVYAQYPHMLSGGMRQRALIAMGIAGDANLLLADEPTKGLDGRRIDIVVDTFYALAGQTILCVTHDLRFAERIADKVAVMYASQKIEETERNVFFTRPLHPYSRAMIEALPERGLHASVGFAPPRRGVVEAGCVFADRCPDRHKQCQESPPEINVGGGSVRCWNYA